MQHDDILDLLAAGRYDEAFALVLESFREKVFRLACGILRDETQAEDAAQEIFVKIWKALPTYHGGASLSTWVYTITRNTCLTELKKRTRHPTISLAEPEMEAVAGTVDPERGREGDIKTLLNELPENYRQVIVLFYLEQKSYEETALMLGIPLGTVKTLLFRAKKELLRIGTRQEQITPAPSSARRTISRQSGDMMASLVRAVALPKFLLQ
jgi:RNA polymerase sigma-70 factor (ECF subfamily)